MDREKGYQVKSLQEQKPDEKKLEMDGKQNSQKYKPDKGEGWKEDRDSEKASFFQKMIIPSLLYAMLYTFFLYGTLSGITMPLCTIATIVYCYYGFKVLDVLVKKDTVFYAAVLVLIGISSAATGNSCIIAMNTIALTLILVSMLVHNFYEDRGWGFVKSLGAIAETFLYTIESLVEPVSDGICYQKLNKKKTQSRSIYIVIGVMVSIPLAVFIIVLLYQADAVFAEVIRRVFENIDLATVFAVCVLFVFAFFSSYSGIRALEKRKISAKSKDYQHFEPLVAITALVIISVIYIFFSVIQIVYLFLGKMQLPRNYTYAQYARQGFFQLLLVCLINVVLVLFVLGFFKRHKFLNILLAVISGCTYIMLASSAFRMVMYVRNCGLTLMRILVLWTIVLIGILLVGILVQIFKDGFPLFRYGLLVISVWYLALSFGHPDYAIAKYNLSGKVNQDKIDYEYLSKLSSDAAPVIVNYKGGWVEKYISRITRHQGDSLRKYNFSREKALALFKDDISKLDNCFCIALWASENIKLEDVTLQYCLNDNGLWEGEVKTEKISTDGKAGECYIAYLSNDILQEGQNGNLIRYCFYNDNEFYTSDQWYLTASKGRTYVMRMGIYANENVNRGFSLYPDVSY